MKCNWCNKDLPDEQTFCNNDCAFRMHSFLTVRINNSQGEKRKQYEKALITVNEYLKEVL